MRNLIRAAALLLAMLAAPASARPDTLSLQVMSWNMRLDLASDGDNAWAHRSALFASVLRYEQPDLIGMQEVLDHQKRDVEAALPDYAVIGVGRDDGAAAGEYSPIFYRRDRFELLDSGTFWLSETPDTPSKGWDAAYPRIATWGHFRDQESGRTFWMMNTHFDHIGEVARLNSAQMIRRWMAEHGAPDELTFITGDFNATSDSAPMRALTGQTGDTPALIDARDISETPPFGPTGTFTGFDITKNEAAPIDHILLGRAARILRYGVLTFQEGGRLPSDHYPVLVTINWGG